MKCYFLRHGIAVEPEDWSGTDFDRPLTEKGTKQMARAAKSIAALGLKLDAIVTSPLVRAKQTAKLVASAIDMDPIEDARLGGGFGPGRLAEVLADHPAAESILLVGHEPAISRTVAYLCGEVNLDYKKGTLARIDVPNRATLHGTLVWLIPAKALAL